MRNPHRKKRAFSLFLLLFTAVICAFVFIAPIVLTVTNSFMRQSELNANYGVLYSTGKIAARSVNLKFIPDAVTFSQYGTILLKSPDYLFKFWNSVILVFPIVVFQLIVALLAAYSFTRWRGRLREILFFAYIALMLMVSSYSSKAAFSSASLSASNAAFLSG